MDSILKTLTYLFVTLALMFLLLGLGVWAIVWLVGALLARVGQ